MGQVFTTIELYYSDNGINYLIWKLIIYGHWPQPKSKIKKISGVWWLLQKAKQKIKKHSHVLYEKVLALNLKDTHIWIKMLDWYMTWLKKQWCIIISGVNNWLNLAYSANFVYIIFWKCWLRTCSTCLFY